MAEVFVSVNVKQKEEADKNEQPSHLWLHWVKQTADTIMQKMVS